MMEARANPYHDPGNGRFTSGPGGGAAVREKGGGGTKYAPSPRRSGKGITVSAKRYARLTGTLNTQYPGLGKGEIRTIRDAKYKYTVRADGFGGMTVVEAKKIK